MTLKTLRSMLRSVSKGADDAELATRANRVARDLLGGVWRAEEVTFMSERAEAMAPVAGVFGDLVGEFLDVPAVEAGIQVMDPRLKRAGMTSKNSRMTIWGKS